MLQDLPYPARQNIICTPIFNNIPLWSLSYEWWFYLLYFPVLKLVENKKPGLIYIICIAATATYIIYPFFINRLLMYLAIWWVGVDLAKLYSTQNLSLSALKKQIFALTICSSLLAANFLIHGNGLASLRKGGIGFSPFLEVRNFSFSIIALLIALFWRSKNWAGFSKSVGLFLPLAPISFCIYISHWFLIVEAHYLENLIVNTYFKYMLYFTICLSFSYLVERVLYVYADKKLTLLLKRNNRPATTITMAKPLVDTK
jgi:peptidoglycan/LPS O-acetylase OafA/YrhL